MFVFMAEQVGLMGMDAKEEPVLRVAYNDINESVAIRQVY